MLVYPTFDVSPSSYHSPASDEWAYKVVCLIIWLPVASALASVVSSNHFIAVAYQRALTNLFIVWIFSAQAQMVRLMLIGGVHSKCQDDTRVQLLCNWCHVNTTVGFLILLLGVLWTNFNNVSVSWMDSHSLTPCKQLTRTLKLFTWC